MTGKSGRTLAKAPTNAPTSAPTIEGGAEGGDDMAKASPKYLMVDKRGTHVYRRRIPKGDQYRFKGATEFSRALPGKDDAERSLQYAAAAAEYQAIVSGKIARAASKGVIPRVGNAHAPPLSPEAVKLNRELADIQSKLDALDVHDDAEPDDPYTLAEATKRFVNDPLRNATAETKKAYAPRLETLCAILGPDTLAAAITREEYRKAVGTLYKLPREYRRKFTNLTPQQAIDRASANEPLFSAKTRSLYLETWGTFFDWCRAEGVAASSPANGVRAPKVEANKARQEAWKTPALNTLFDAPLFRNPVQRVAQPGAFWAPIISLHQGMRCGEIVMLDRSELIDVEGVWCFNIRERPGRSLKTKSSARVVPVHRELLRLGLVEHLHSLPTWTSPSPEWPQGPLFPDLMTNKRGKAYSDPTDKYGRAFKALATELGLRAAESGQEGHVFHALRHRFTTACRAGRMPDSVRLYLGGWAQKEGVASGYGDQDMPALRDELERVKYPGVTLPRGLS